MHSSQKYAHQRRSQPLKEIKKKSHIVNKENIRGFQSALAALNEKLDHLPKTAQDSTLYSAGMKVYKLINDVQIRKESKVSEAKLTEILKSTAHIVGGPEDYGEGPKGYTKLLDKYHSLANDIRRFPVGKFLGSMMLGLIGTAIVAASGIIMAASFGLLAPISLFGIVFGVSMIAGGIAAGTTAIGAGAVMGSGILFFSAAKSNPLRGAMEEVEIAAREHYGCR